MADDDMSKIQCADCGIAYLVPDRWKQARRDDHKTFWCPNGHTQYFPGETEAEKLRRERDHLKQRIAQRDDWVREERERRAAVERQLAAQKGQVTKLKNRAGAGVCPCCNRTFQALARHMAAKHPQFACEAAE
jgi:hypothetical protein